MGEASIEISEIAAEVSWSRAFYKRRRVVYDKTDDGFCVVSHENGAKPIQDSFRNYPSEWTFEEKRDAFWKLERSHDCNNIVAIQLAVCKALLDLGLTLVHKGVLVKNFFAVNGGFDVSDLEDLTLTVADPEDLQKLYRVGLYSTVPNNAALASFPEHVLEFLGQRAPDGNDADHTRQIADYLKIPVDKFVPHWWCCYVLENSTMIHMDLCGPAYGMCAYSKRVSLAHDATDIDHIEAPVCIIESPALCIAPLHPNVAKYFPHKLQMTRRADDGAGLRSIRLPPSFRPYSHEKMNPEITPVDAIMDRHREVLASFAIGMESIVNRLGLQAIGRSASTRHLMVRIQNISQRRNLIGKSAKVHSISGDRVAVQLQSGEGIRLLPSKLVVQSNTLRPQQFMLLAEMKESAERLVQNASDSKLCPGDEVIIDGLQSAAYLNGKGATIVEFDVEADRFIVRVPSLGGEQKLVRRGNLSLHRRHEFEGNDAEELQAINEFLQNDPLGSKFFNRVLVTVSTGLTNITDPEILPAFEKLVHMRFGTLLLKSPPQQRQWEAILKLTKKESWKEFREVVQKMRIGEITGAAFGNLCDRNPEMHEMYQTCLAEGIFKQREA